MLGRLLREVRRVWDRTGQPADLTQKIIDMAHARAIPEAMALASTHEHDGEIAWAGILDHLANQGKNVGPLLYLCLRRAYYSAPALLALGRWLASNNEPLRASQCAQMAHRLQPHEPSPLILQGWLHLSLGNPLNAAKQFAAALQRDEGNREALHGYKTAMRLATGQVPVILPADEALEAQMRQSISAAPDDPTQLLALGKHYALTSRKSLALPYLRKAHELAPGNAQTSLWLAATLAGLGDDQTALDITIAGLAEHPEGTELLKQAAECALRLDREPQAMVWLQQIVALGKADATTYNNLGDCFNQREEFEQAVPLLSKALELDPSLGESRHNLAYALHCLGRYAEAREHLDILLASDRNDFSARWYRSTTLLAAHCYREGWQDYEFRFVSTAVEGRLIPLPLWRGESLSGRKIVVTAEQGIGDELMFASCLPELVAVAGKCVIECNKRLLSLYRRSFPHAEVVEWINSPNPPWLEKHGDADFHVFCGSLPLHFRGSAETFATTRPHLVADADQIAHFRTRLASLGAGLKVGVAWRGGAKASRAKTRSLALTQLQPLFGISGCRFVSLQYGDCVQEVEAHNQNSTTPLHHWPEAITDLDAFAALVAALDLIVTVCSAPVHFAGGLGKPALVLTPYAPEWRYRGVAGRMVWYPSLRLFPQQALDDWDGVISAVAETVGREANRHAV